MKKKKDYFRSFLLAVGVIQQKTKLSKGFKKEYVVRRFNPYHPLTYLLILIMMILAALTGLVKLPYELITEIKDEFRYR